MIRRLMLILSILSLMACICTAFFWVRSYRHGESLMRCFERRSTSSHLFEVLSVHGHVGIGVGLCDWYDPKFRYAEDHWPFDPEPFFELERPHWRGDRWIPEGAIIMSYSVPTLAFAILPTAMLLRRRMTRGRRGFPISQKGQVA
jgi:hypothetical protein